jgi:hypothetical protein
MEQRPFGGGDERSRKESETAGERVQRFHFGPWVFNVNGARAIIAESSRETKPLPVEPWVRFYGLAEGEGGGVPLLGSRNLDRAYALTTDLSEPVLVATLRNESGEEFPLLIDGTHRLYRAYAEQVAELPAHVLTVEETLAIREDGYIGGFGRRERG